MAQAGIFQLILFLIIVLLCVKPLGWYMAQIYLGKQWGFTHFLHPIEKAIYRVCLIDSEKEMTWKQYLSAMLFFNGLGMLLVYTMQRLQVFLPLNPQHFSSPFPSLAFNTAASYVTKTNWQYYAGEKTLSYFTQMCSLTTENFLSAATGIAILLAFIRGLVRREQMYLGNFWVDIVRSVLYIFLPLSFVLAVALASQGVIQNFKPYQKAILIQPIHYDVSSEKKIVSEQIIPGGPVASQVAIKQLASAGGGFFNVNSTHPFENPTPLSNFLELLAIVLIPAALCYTFGLLVNDKRQGWAILAVMFFLFIPAALLTMHFEQQGNPLLASLGVKISPENSLYSGGNMEGKETRFGIASSALWTVTTTATSNGSVNSMLDSYEPLSTICPFLLMHLGEVVLGGVGSGLYGMLLLVIISVFIAGLMVGRTPEYLGKKIEPYEMKMASAAVLVMPLIVLVFTAMSVVLKIGLAAISNPGPHGLSQVLYAFTSMVNNNGSAFAGIRTSTYYNTLGGIAMLIGRYWFAIPTLAIAGSLAKKKMIPTSTGTLQTHTLLFIFLLVGVTLILGALTFFPVLALGPIVEHLMMGGLHGN